MSGLFSPAFSFPIKATTLDSSLEKKYFPKHVRNACLFIHETLANTWNKTVQGVFQIATSK
jgi:hypothetical protein